MEAAKLCFFFLADNYQIFLIRGQIWWVLVKMQELWAMGIQLSIIITICYNYIAFQFPKDLWPRGKETHALSARPYFSHFPMLFLPNTYWWSLLRWANWEWETAGITKVSECGGKSRGCGGGGKRECQGRWGLPGVEALLTPLGAKQGSTKGLGEQVSWCFRKVILGCI